MTAFCVAAVAVGPLHAQAVRGVLVERGNNRPIRGAFVVLLDAEDAEVARVLTDDAGRFLIRAPAPGRYRLQSKRIGFRLTVSPPLALEADQTVVHRMEVEVVPAMLPPVVVEGRPQCGSRGEVGSVTARLWEEAREALSAVSWTSDQRLHRYQLLHFVRDFGPGGDRPISDSSWTTSGYAEAPFSSLPAQELADRGFVVKGRGDTVDYYAPDANVLLSTAFLNTHCFTAREGEGEHEGLVGLAFEPAPGRFLPDIKGVLWFDRRSAELRGLAYSYTNLPPELPEEVLGGAIDFMRLATGAWIVQRWWIRMARMGRVVYRDTGRMPEARVLGFRQRGGQVLSISTTRGTVVYSARQAILEGTVYDSTRGMGLSRATVFLVSTTDSVRADEQGAFSLVVPRDGPYGVSFRHPRVDSLGVEAPTTPVVLRTGSRSIVSLAVPPEARLIQSLCPEEPLRPGERVLVGVVREHGSGRPVRGARVEARWQTVGGARGALQVAESLVRSVADSAGRYVVCRAPLGLVRVRAVIEGGTPVEAVYRFAEEGVWLNDDRYRSFAGRIWTVNFTLPR